MLQRLHTLTQSKTNFIGLDLGSESIKLLQINSSASPKRIEKFAVSKIPHGSIVKNEIKDYDLVANILKSAVKQGGFQTTNLALAIPRSSTIIKNINIDNRLNSEEIETRAWIEANHHFPDLVGDSYLDFSINGISPQDPNQLELILVACRKEVIKPYLEVAKAAGLTLKIVDINSFALERSLALIAPTHPDLETIALLNFDISLSTLIVLQKQKLIYAHDETFDGQRLQNQLRESDNDEIKKQTALKENLSAYLRHAMHFFYSSRPNVAIEKIFLSGDCALEPSLLPFIQQEIGVEMDVANPFQTMEFNSHLKSEELKKYAPALVLCTGLALSTMN